MIIILILRMMKKTLHKMSEYFPKFNKIYLIMQLKQIQK